MNAPGPGEKPNMELVQHKPYLRTIRTINKGEELTVRYGRSFQYDYTPVDLERTSSTPLVQTTVWTPQLQHTNKRKHLSVKKRRAKKVRFTKSKSYCKQKLNSKIDESVESDLVVNQEVKTLLTGFVDLSHMENLEQCQQQLNELRQRQKNKNYKKRMKRKQNSIIKE